MPRLRLYCLLQVDSKDMNVFLVAPTADASDKNVTAPGTSTSTDNNDGDDTPFDNDYNELDKLMKRLGKWYDD